MNIAFLLLAVLPQSDWLSTVSIDEPPAKVVSQEADWISTVTPEAPAPAPQVDDCKCECEDVAPIVIAHEQEIQALRADVEALRQKLLTTKMSAPQDLSPILRDIAELKSRPAFTEAEIRAFAKDEIEKFHAQVKLSSGEVKTVKAQSVQATVNGFSGTFEVPPGGVITHINGQPVNRSNGWVRTVDPVSNRTVSAVGQVPNYRVQMQPVRSGVRFFAAPRSNSTCRIVNGVQVCN